MVLGTGSDSEYMDVPFLTSHFFYDCLIGSTIASSEVPIHALIDHGCDTVLIDPEYVKILKLTPHHLPKFKEVVMVVGNGKKDVFVLEEWVPLTIISPDQAWKSHTCRAILAPNLYVLVLLHGNQHHCNRSQTLYMYRQKNWL